MGFRSGVYACYYAAMFGVMLSLTLFMWGYVVPGMPDCAERCPVLVLRPSRFIGGSAPACGAARNFTDLLASGCFSCDGGTALWPCPGGGGVGCDVDTLKRAAPCGAGLTNLTDLDGRPVVDVRASAGPGVAARCLPHPSCAACVAAGACADVATFTGGGRSREGLCFTTPLAISLRSSVLPTLYLWLIGYALMVAVLAALALLTWQFRP